MKKLKISSLALGIVVAGGSSSIYAQLMFSQYVDGNKNQKGLEIFNPDAVQVNLADYEIRQYSNGKITSSSSINLKGVLAPNQKFLIGRGELQETLGDRVHQKANLAFNGDDTLVLYYKGTAVDRFGILGEEPANGWGMQKPYAKDNSFSRKAKKNDVTSIDPKAPFDLNADWTVWDNRNNFDKYLGGGDTGPEKPIEKVSCSSTDTPIVDVLAAKTGERYTIRGILTADYRYKNGLSGFYVQTPDSKAKKDLSNAVFVYIPESSKITGGKVGQEVVLNGRLSLYQNQLQIDNLAQNILDCNQADANAIVPIDLSLPFQALNGTTGHVPQRYQGMLVKLPQTLTVSENYNYGRFGELSLSPERLYIPTNLYPAGSAQAKAMAESNQRSKLILDDANGSQNLTPWLPTQFNAKNTLRAGDQLKNVQGIFEYRFNQWRVQPIAHLPKPELISTKNPRSAVAAKNPKQIRTAAFNVLNYDNGLAKGFPTERGADTKVEFERQHAKIVSALKDIDADVYTLMEIANNGYSDQSAIAYLTRSLGPDWTFVRPPNGANQLGTDAIAVAIIYNKKRVKPVNDAVVFDDKSEKNRVTMAQSFQALNSDKIFTVIPNHLKSKGCSGATGLEADQDDGQACWNPTRVKHVNELIAWMAKNPTKIQGSPNFLLLGDMNSYAKEDPMLALEKANFKVLLNDEQIGMGKKAYSYVFGVSSDKRGFGGAGNIDHAVADQNLYPWVKRAFTWAINADEPTVLDYNQEYKTEQQIKDFYSTDAYRSSDHDPVIVDLDFNPETGGGSGSTDGGSSGGGSSSLWSVLGLIGLSLTAFIGRRKRH